MMILLCEVKLMEFVVFSEIMYVIFNWVFFSLGFKYSLRFLELCKSTGNVWLPVVHLLAMISIMCKSKRITLLILRTIHETMMIFNVMYVNRKLYYVFCY
jgi:hypothetical protein